jgi:hypothetical protein
MTNTLDTIGDWDMEPEVTQLTNTTTLSALQVSQFL